MLEKTIERRCCARVLDELGVVSVKLVTPGCTGYPDKMFLIPGGKPMLVEFKRPGEVPRPKQSHIHARLKQLGYHVEVHDDEEAAFQSVKQALGASGVSEDSGAVPAGARVRRPAPGPRTR